MSDFKKGDLVRVTVEGEVFSSKPGSTEFMIKRSEDGAYNWFPKSAVVEVLSVPVEQFEPGDVVENIHSGTRYALARNGYVSLQTGHYYKGSDLTQFNSGKYKRVNL